MAPHRCSYQGCEKSYKHRNHLTEHVKHIHQNRSRYRCNTCHRILPSKRAMRDHLRNVHRERPKIMVICDVCSREVQKKNYALHKKNATALPCTDARSAREPSNVKLIIWRIKVEKCAKKTLTRRRRLKFQIRVHHIHRQRKAHLWNPEPKFLHRRNGFTSHRHPRGISGHHPTI